MERLKFWKRRDDAAAPAQDVPTIKRFNIEPRTDVGSVGLPPDPDKAARLVALRKRREALLRDLAAAEAATSEQNRWHAEIALIEQAIAETDRDIDEIGPSGADPGVALPATPITAVEVETEPVARVRFSVGDREFAYAEEIDWAERGFQVTRGELIRESGDIDSVIPAHVPDEQRPALREHLERSLFVFATDLRDRALNQEEPPAATLADLARPSATFGGWLDWAGQSASEQQQQIARNRLLMERERLERERAQLFEDQLKAAEGLPVARRRLAELEREIEAITPDT